MKHSASNRELSRAGFDSLLGSWAARYLAGARALLSPPANTPERSTIVFTSTIPGGGMAAISVDQFVTIDEYAQNLAQEKGDIAGIVVMNELSGQLTVSFQSAETQQSVGGIRVDFDGQITEEVGNVNDFTPLADPFDEIRQLAETLGLDFDALVADAEAELAA